MNIRSIHFQFLQLGILLSTVIICGCSNSESKEVNDQDIRNAVVKYLASPRYAGPTFDKQILGDISFELYDLDSNFLYFSMPERLCGNDSGKAALAHIIRNYDSLQWSQEQNGVLFFNDVRGRHTEDRGCLFRTGLTNIKVDTGLVLHFPFPETEYTLSLKEMAAYFINREIYGGSREVYRDDGKNGNYTLFINHGIFVGRPGEPSLKRLVAGLTESISPTDPEAREKKIQKVLNFVTQDIAYDYGEAAKSYEVMKRPSETIMSRRSDCSNKATLFASLLEQLGEDYLLVYSPYHINVAVPKGKFPETNGHFFDWENGRWIVCETTCNGFRIGEDVLEKKFGFDQVEYVQRPKDLNVIINAHSGAKLTLR